MDAIGTLLRREGARLHAENTFAIQIKSWSTRKLKIKQARLDWLARFELPLFWVSIDLARGRGSIYSLINLILPWPTADGVEVLLDQPAGAPLYTSQPWIASEPLTGPKPARMWVGPSVLDFDFADVDEPEFGARAYAVLKPHVELMARCLIARRFGVYSGVRWESGGPPSITMSVLHGGEDIELRDVLEAMFPLLMRVGVILRHGFGGTELRKEVDALMNAERGQRISRPLDSAPLTVPDRKACTKAMATAAKAALPKKPAPAKKAASTKGTYGGQKARKPGTA